MAVDFGKVRVKTGSPVALLGAHLKCVGSGLVAQRIETQATIKAATAGNFSNQPANDSVTVVSDAAGDTTQTVTIYGTTNGASPLLIVSEVITLNGTTPVVSAKVNWGLVLAVVISAAHTGTVTVSETSGGLAITTLASGTLSKGYNAVDAADQNAFGSIPAVVADGASTKYVGIIYTTIAGVTASEVKQLNGTNPVAYTTRAARVTAVLGGDVATGTVATVKTAASETSGVTAIGRAWSTGTTEGDLITAYIPPIS